MSVHWLIPNNDERNVTVSIDKVFIGMSDQRLIGKKKKYYCKIKTPIVSQKTYTEIVSNILRNNDKKDKTFSLKYFKISKQTKNFKKSDIKTYLKFILTICPNCRYSNCPEYEKKDRKRTKHNTTIINRNVFPRYIKCFNCLNIFQTLYHKLLSNSDIQSALLSKNKCLGWQCLYCRKKYENGYNELLDYYNNQNNKNHEALQSIMNNDNDKENCLISRRKKVQRLLENLSDNAKREVSNNIETFYYAIQVRRDCDEKLITIPPISFLIDMNKPQSFYETKLLHPIKDNFHLDVKTHYGSVNSRAQGGKNSLYRNNCLNKRHGCSARVVIVPRCYLMPHECILPKTVYQTLNCPKYILCHRYPTLDIRSMTYHNVLGVWDYPCLAISTAIVSGNNADFDGDCIHVIPATNLPSQAELIYLCHPKYNMIVQKQLRVKFDHDEIQTIYSQFGLTSTEIHDGLLSLAQSNSSPLAYEVFCNLKRYCRWIWEYRYINTVSFLDYTDIYDNYFKQPVSYLDYVSKIFPSISPQNGIKEMILAHSSRFSIDHLWQIFGEINHKAKGTGFLNGMTKSTMVDMAIASREAMLKDVGYHGYNHIKLTHCTRSLIVGYDGKVYTADGILVCQNIPDIY